VGGTTLVAMGATSGDRAPGEGAAPPAAARIVLVDDHAIVRHGLRALLEGRAGIRVVGEAGDAAEAVRVVEATRPEIVLLDLRLGADSCEGSLALCRTLSSTYGLRVLMLSAFVSERLVVRAIQSGARGYVLKDVDTDELLKAVEAVRRGESAFDSHVAAVVVRSLSVEEPGQGPGALSEREEEVLALVGRGWSNQEIGRQLYISATTVKFHLRNIMRKLGVHRRAELAYRAGQFERLGPG
jgi:two-component system response regulator DevR